MLALVLGMAKAGERLLWCGPIVALRGVRRWIFFGEKGKEHSKVRRDIFGKTPVVRLPAFTFT